MNVTEAQRKQSREEMPEFVEPMLAKSSALPREESEWAFEVKWDGVRAIARSTPEGVSLRSRNDKDISPAYPELAALRDALGSHEALLDGEIVGFDVEGRPSFEALQARMHQRDEAMVMRLSMASPVTYMVFDLLWLDGESLLDLPYLERRERLADLGIKADRWQTPGFYVGEGTALLAASREQALEGIVGKRLSSKYVPGGRGGSWIKIKNIGRQEFVIGGWTEGKGSRSRGIGALQIGVYDDGALRYAGGVGTGFTEAELDRLAGLLGPLERGESPFEGPQPPKGAHFAEPELVCEVEFTAWTREGALRHPSYKGLREDKAAIEVMREMQPAR
jgi:bifunctional non-homologous end joining protein LigD